MTQTANALAGLPVGLRTPLLHSYREIARNYAEHRWEPSELNGGKFCEAAYAIIAGAVTGSYPPKVSKPKDMVAACRALEAEPANPQRVGDRSLRILIPRMLLPLYEIRNNRGVGHLGGDVDPNFMDATAVLGMASWILAELVRIFHQVSTEEAQAIVDALVERKTPLIWEISDTNMKRVLDHRMETKDQTLLLLHKKLDWVPEKDLADWIEYSSVSMFRRRVLIPLHKNRLIEYDQPQGRARISPLGIREVEERILRNKAA